MIQHFILTRSCYRQTDPAFLQYRFRMMRDFCAASLVAQTRRDFAWLVRLNPRSPVANDVAAFLESLPFRVLAICSPPPARDASDTIYTEDANWKQAIHSALEPETAHVLTTRVDDDDLLAPDFVERLRRKAKPSPKPAVYNFPVGYVLKLSTAIGSQAARWRFPKNQFASLISPVEPLVLINDEKHGCVNKLGPITLIDEKPAFVWTRHPRTKSQGGRFKVNIPVQRLAKQFPALKCVK